MVDVKYEINAVSRQVGTRTLDAGEARVGTLIRTYNAEPEDVWEAITTPERLARWFAPVSGELREGGQYAIKGNASGTVQRCEPPRGFDATWEFGGEVSWIEVRLSEVPGGTRVELQHIAHVDDERWLQYGPGATGVGWDLGFLGLSLHLSDPAARDAFDEEAWAASDEGKEYVTLSGERWYDASVAAGTPEADARAAADRTTAFYTGA
ncbi:activator of HSP90 ATPase [Virgisporangium aliadipatigenens]|uniref:Activator of HSP90 ATPase n=1 Tax=Virgisporangium aliadipatigenens TaxID=741659 RepID=A0A8J3YJI3_9ACTN|nr:SRPBCC family protein [Virgisporangium aliadipatigenens]GIJ46291.1 activator of HSP90 ATPase [Virgisporangium aliadipatigenens]